MVICKSVCCVDVYTCIIKKTLTSTVQHILNCMICCVIDGKHANTYRTVLYTHACVCAFYI